MCADRLRKRVGVPAWQIIHQGGALLEVARCKSVVDHAQEQFSMRGLLAAFIAGTWWLQQQQALSLVWPAGLCAACGMTAWLCRRHYRPVTIVAWTCCAFLGGQAWAALRADIRLADRLDPAWEGRDVVVQGAVASLPTPFERGVRFQFDVLASTPPGVVPQRLALTRYDAPDAAASTMLAPLVPGDRWQLRLRLRQPVGSANPHTFDYEYWLLEQGVRATGYVRAGPDNRRLSEAGMRVGWRIERWRDAVRRHVLASMPAEAPYAGVLVALVVGDQRGIDAADWNMFNRTGIGHLISISGLHITMIASLFGVVVAWLWRYSFGLGRWLHRPLPLRWPARSAGIVAGMVAATLYCLLAGMQVPAQRTLIMLTVVGLGFLAGRGSHRGHVLGWAAVLVVLADPWAVCAAGFWLSFGAVALIFLMHPVQYAPAWGTRMPRRWTGVAAAARLQWVLTVGLVPLTLLLFQQVSVVSPLANAVAIPVVSFIVTPLALLGAALPEPVAMLLLAAAHTVFAWLVVILAWLGTQPWAVWQAAAPPAWAVLAGMAGVTLWLVPGGVASWPLRVHACVLLLPLCLVRAPRPAHGEWRITALDVGQGTAVLVETAQHRLLYDAGPAYGASSAGERVIAPYLRGLGAAHLDRLVISHEDSDHVGGAPAVLDAVHVSRLQAALPAGHMLWQTATQQGTATTVCAAGQHWEWDGVRFEILHPAPGDGQRETLASNARSCVLRVANIRHAALLTGDIGLAEELQIIGRSIPGHLLADILLVPHHGSGTSSGSRFLEAVAPSLAIFQMGYRNRYGHPRADVWARYGAYGVQRLRTDRAGAVMVDSAGPLLEVSAWRDIAPRYWHVR